MTTKIGYIVGSLSSTSINRAVFEAVRRHAPEGVEVREIEIKDLPMYAQDHDANFPEAASAFKAALAEVDAVVVASPCFNNSFSGAVKNAIDWSSRPWGQHSFTGKPTAIATASIGSHGGRPAGDGLHGVLTFGEAKVLETQLNVFVGEGTFTEDGDFADEALRTEARDFLAALAANAQA